MKLRAMLAAERLLNAITKTFGMRVIFMPQSGLHSEDLSFRADGLITSHTVNFLNDARFHEVIAGIRTEVRHTVYHLYRIYIAVALAELASKVPGSIFVECGVGEGITSLAINRYLAGIPRTYLVDTYSGIDPSQLQARELRGSSSAEEHRRRILKSYQTSDFESVTKRFAEFTHITLVRGSVPQVLSDNESLFSSPVSFLHIDMNNAAPEYAALKFFYSRLSVPAFVLLDDYAFKSMSPQKEAIDKACRELGIPQPISLPTGQGLIIKTSR
jgi:Methyltransferase domain